MDSQFTITQANHIYLASVRRRLAESNQLLNHVQLLPETSGIVYKLIESADLAVTELMRID